MPIDQNRASELFTWKCAREHLSADGTMGVLLSIKSLISPSATKFAKGFSSYLAVRSVTNLSHFRYRLFVNARAPAVVVVAQKAPRQLRDTISVYSPSLASQPIDARSGWPWAIVVDRASVRAARYDVVSASARTWFEGLMLSPVDRQIVEHLNDLCDTKRASRLGDFKKSIGLETGRGGSPAQTKVSHKYILGTGNNENNYIKRLKLGNPSLFEEGDSYVLPQRERRKVDDNFQFRFGGNVLLVTRTGKEVVFVKEPIAFNSSLHAINFTSADIDEDRLRFLCALRAYLNSDFVQYAMALYGHLWLLDGRRFEMEDLRQVPVPFAGLSDARVTSVLECSDVALDDKIMDLFEMPFHWRSVVREYLAVRRGFQDGKVPLGAVAVAEGNQMSEYKAALASKMDKRVSSGRFFVDVSTAATEDLGVVAVVYGSQDSAPDGLARIKNAALKEYERTLQNPFTDSLSLRYDRDAMAVSMVKPLESMHWTVERALSDCDAILRQIASAGRRAFEVRG